MNGEKFVRSKWCKEGATEAGRAKIKRNFGVWARRVGNLGLISRAKQLYEFFLSPEITGTKKVVVAGALLYLIAPLDLIPDVLPVVGWLDDIGVASFALSYIFSQMDALDSRPENVETDVQSTPQATDAP